MRHPSSTPLQDDRFLLLCSLGRGGMGAVFRAFDRVDQRMVALKVGSDREPAGPAHPLSAEFELWTRLSHPNVVAAYELAMARRGPLRQGAPYLVLEHVDGLPLQQVLEPGRSSSAELEALCVQLLRGLEHVHAAGLVHRDVKPSNVLVQPGPRGTRVKLTDFGLATAAGESDEPGRLSGSLPYVAPESILGRPLDGRADLYALGVLLFQLATGRLPVAGCKVEEILHWHLAGPPADPRRLRPRFPAALARFIARLTSRDRDGRPASAARALEALGADPSPSPPSAAIPTATRARLRLALDAARLGARRLYRLPAGSTVAARAAVRPLRAWAQIFGLAYHDLGFEPEDGGDGSGALVRLLLRLMLERGDGGRARIERLGLHRWLSLTWLGGTPVAGPPHVTRPLDDEGARRIAAFLLDAVDGRGLVLVCPRPNRAAPATRGVIGALVRRLARPWPPCPGRGGMLLVLTDTREGGRLRRPATGPDNSARA